MKKYLLTLITLTFFLCEASFTGGGIAFAATAISGTGLTWEYATIGNTKTLTITYSGSGSSEIPDYSATTRAPWYASYRTQFTKIVIGSGVTKIGNYAFNGCTALYSASFTNDLRTIGSYAFNGCSNFQVPNLPDNLETIMTHAFDGCSKLSTITIPANVTSIGQNAFNGCTKITKVNWNAVNCNNFSSTSYSPFYSIRSQITNFTIGSNVEHIPAYVCYGMNHSSFSGTTNTISIPASVQSIGRDAFYECSTLKYLDIPANVTSIGIDAFWNCSSLKSVVFASGTSPVEFGNYLFEGCSALKYVVLPSTLTSLPNNTFKGCSALEAVVIPESVTSVTNTAFNACSALKTILATPTTAPSLTSEASGITPGNIKLAVLSEETKANYQSESSNFWYQFDITTQIGGDCGISGSNVTWVLDFKTGLLTISGSGAMANYGSSETNPNFAPWYFYKDYITDIEVKNGVTTLGEYAFIRCNLDSCSINASVTEFKSGCFFSTTTKALHYNGTLTQWCDLSLTGTNVFPTTLNLYINGGLVEKLILPEITSLHTKAFMNMKGITSVTILTSITSIGADAFSGCTNIKNVYYQGSLAQWCAINFSNSEKANPAFNGASLHITDSDIDEGAVYVKDAITSISNYAFCGVTNYTSIEINAATTLGANTFRNCTAQILYRGSASGTSGNVTWTWEDGILTLSGSGTMNNYNSTSAPWYPYMASTHEIIVGENITSIGNYAFYGYTATPITLSLPSTLETIGQSAFYGLTYLQEVVLPESITTIGQTAFSGCIHLTKIYCPSTIPTLSQPMNGIGYNFPDNAPFYVSSESYASQYAGKWTTYGFTPRWFVYGNCGVSGNNVTFVFEESTGTLTISGSGAMATYNSSSIKAPWYDYRHSITRLIVDEGITSIGAYAFHYCDINDITIPSTLTSIGGYAFYGNKFSSITLPTLVSEIGNYAFFSNSNLASVTSNATTPPSLGTYTFPTHSTKKLYLPHNVVTKANYRNASGWSSFTEANTFPKIVQFDLNGKSGAAPTPLYFDNLTSKATAPDDPADDGYFVFDKWCSDVQGESQFNFASTDITEDQTLYAKWGLNGTISISEADNNSTKLSDYNGRTVNVNLTRTIRHESYNTICLPFSVSAEQVETALGADCDIRELTDAVFHGESLDLVFTQRDAIEGGKPYLIQPTATIVNPSFSSVTITNEEVNSVTDYIDFIGVFSPTLLAQSSNLLFLKGNNALYMSSGGTMNGLRAYFELKSDAAVQAGVAKRIYLSFSAEDTATGVDSLSADPSQQTVKVIRDGQLLIIRDGKTYNAQGVRIE